MKPARTCPARLPTRRIPKIAERILQSIRDARKQADLVIVYQHNHVFGNHSFSTIFTEGMQERLAPIEWLRSGRTRRWTPAPTSW